MDVVFLETLLIATPLLALHEALGFTPVGIYRDVGFKFGAWRDVGWWQKRLREPGDLPSEPRAYRGGSGQ